MEDLNLWEVVKSTVQYIVLPALAAFTYFLRKYLERVEKTEEKLSSMEVRLSIVESKITDIRNDLKIIKRGVIKLVDRENGRS